MLGWLTRLFGRRDQAESDSAPPASPPPAETSATVSAAAITVETAAEAPAPTTDTISPPASEALADGENREVCPTCGKTSVFAGPPGHRYCMHCALREELFDASAAARQ